MSAFIVWIDQEHAKLFQFAAGKQPVETQVKRITHDHHTHGKHEHADAEHQAYFHDVAKHLVNATEILLVGPGLAREHFRTHLKKHHHSALEAAIVGSEPMDHPTDPQILAHARKFFKTRDLFTESVLPE